MKKHLLAASFGLMLFLIFAVPVSNAKPSEYDMIVRHLKTNYKAKKIKIPGMFLARFVVSMVRPAGVKSFSVTLFEDLKFSRENLDKEMQSALRNSFTGEWRSILRARTAEGQQAYMYMREEGKNVKIALVTIDKKNAAVIRATFSPERLVEFVNDPTIFGINLNSKQPDTKQPDAGADVKKAEQAPAPATAPKQDH
jgi:hypothetical protein